jgi:parallel beta-helix repeat protein
MKTRSFSSLLFLLPVVPLAEASTIHVPGDQPTIQAGIGAAATGDTVLVAPGLYHEHIDFVGKAIRVVSSGGPLVTTIDGSGSGPIASFHSGEGNASLLRGFTLQNGITTFEGGGVFIDSSSPTIWRNVVRNCGGCNGGGGIAIAFASPVIRQNVIANNFQAGCSGGIGGGGISVRGAGSARILGNVIQGNSWSSAQGGGISLFAAGTPTLANNIVRSNTAGGGQGGGMWIVNVSDALVVQNLFYGNTGSQASAIYFLVPSGAAGPKLVNNTLVGSAGAATVVAAGFDGLARFDNNVVVGAAGQTAVLCDGQFGPSFPIFTQNDAYSPGGTGLGGTCAPQGNQNGNISADPLFTGAAAGNYRLTGASPAIDAGDNAAPNLPATDLAGSPRIVDGNGDDVATVDMGAYEYH